MKNSKEKTDREVLNERAWQKYVLYGLVERIINELPELQQIFYKDLFATNMNQADVARMYGISPQAITNRLTKLKRTVKKKLLDEYGLTKEDIIRVLNYRDHAQLLRDAYERSRIRGG